MDADEREIFDYLKTFGEEWVNAKEVCRRAAGKQRYYENNNWAKPILHRMKERQILESDELGRYRIKPAPKKGRKGRWVSPDIEKILRESGVKVDAERLEAASDEPPVTLMLAALFTTFLFAASAVCGYRAARQVGGMEANFWRTTLATLFLTAWAFTYGSGFAGAPGWFILSGFFGIGVGDSAYFQALPRLGSRRTVLLTQCLTAPFAALVEWRWLGSRLNLAEAVCVAVILAGVALALAPDDHRKIAPREWKIGIGASVIGALGAALGSVVIRRGYAAIADAGLAVDAGTTGYQRMLGGMVIPTAAILLFKWRLARAHGPMFDPATLRVSAEKWRRIWPWVLANALTGQTLGVTCMQWALKTTPAGIVAAIIATSPLVLLPMTRIVDGEKIGLRSSLGALIAVAGVIGLTFSR